MDLSCPKCGYTRSENDVGSADECPKCGVFYNKARSKSAQPKYSTQKVKQPPRSSLPVNEPAEMVNYTQTIKNLIILLIVVGGGYLFYIDKQKEDVVTEKEPSELQKTISRINKLKGQSRRGEEEVATAFDYAKRYIRFGCFPDMKGSMECNVRNNGDKEISSFYIKIKVTEVFDDYLDNAESYKHSLAEVPGPFPPGEATKATFELDEGVKRISPTFTITNAHYSE